MKCRYENEIYSNADNGYCVYQYVTEEWVPEGARNQFHKRKETVFAAVGYYLPDGKLLEYDLMGNWVKGKHGLQLFVEFYEEVIPDTEEGICQYLSSGTIKGIGPKTAEAIVDKFGSKTFDVFDKEPEKLRLVRGITDKKLSVILESYQAEHSRRELAMFLAPFKLGSRKIAKIQETYGERALEVVKEETYSLCELKGFSFPEVDQIARANQGEPDDPLRIRGCLWYVMELGMKAGNLYEEKETFIRKAYAYLNEGFHEKVVNRQQICAAANQLAVKKELIVDGKAVYKKAVYEQEKETAEALAKLLIRKPDETDIRPLIQEAEEELGIWLSKCQREAVVMAFRYRFSIITGGPGTGKTTVEKVILYVHEQLHDGTVLLMAPTGKASRRMAESTGCEDAGTMHSMLGLQNDDDSYELMMEPLECELLISDEFSMVDMRLGHNFFCRIDEATRLILVGDVNQLPSVGPGSVLKDIISSGCFPVVKLTKIFRQAGERDIIVNAHKINRGEPVVLDNKSMDFFFLKRDDTNMIISNIITLIQKKLPKYVDASPFDIQVMTPTRKGLLGVERLNVILQRYLNPPDPKKEEKEANGRIFRTGDKVMQIKNNYQLEWEVCTKYGVTVDKGMGIFNGDMGIIREISSYKETLTVEYDEKRLVEYPFELLDELELAYAITVHKSQGSEYPAVVIPLLPGPKLLYNRNLLYTAVTRAKKCLTIVGSEDTFQEMIKNKNEQERYTSLDERIQEF